MTLVAIFSSFSMIRCIDHVARKADMEGAFSTHPDPDRPPGAPLLLSAFDAPDLYRPLNPVPAPAPDPPPTAKEEAVAVAVTLSGEFGMSEFIISTAL
jgi:hypothetical protein